MLIVGTRDIARNTKQIFELAKEKKVLVRRRGNEYINLIVSNNPEENFFSESWLKEFLAIPNEYRCNPFEYNLNGNLFFADIRNIESIKQQQNNKTL